MTIKKILVKNYKLLEDTVFNVKPDINIFVGENDSGKSTILEVISILTSGKLNGYALDRQLKANLFNDKARKEYIRSLDNINNVKNPPSIIMEAYCDGTDMTYSGTENELNENCNGIRVVVDIDKDNYKRYIELLKAGEIFDIPVELYIVSYN